MNTPGSFSAIFTRDTVFVWLTGSTLKGKRLLFNWASSFLLEKIPIQKRGKLFWQCNLLNTTKRIVRHFPLFSMKLAFNISFLSLAFEWNKLKHRNKYLSNMWSTKDQINLCKLHVRLQSLIPAHCTNKVRTDLLASCTTMLRIADFLTTES